MYAHLQGHVYGAVLLHAHSDVAFLVKSDSNTAQFVHSSYRHNRAHAKSSSFEVEGDNLGLKQLQSEIDSLLIWDDKKLFYSISAGDWLIDWSIDRPINRLIWLCDWFDYVINDWLIDWSINFVQKDDVFHFMLRKFQSYKHIS